MKVLIAEDDPVSAAVLRRSIEAGGHLVSTVTDGMAAWRAVEQDEPEVIISDWVMPRLDGLELCKRIRSVRRSTYIYIIMLTAKDLREERMEALLAGADDFLVKPLDTAELTARLVVAGRLRDMQHALREHARQLERLSVQLEEQRRELSRANVQLSRLVATDWLTGLSNHRHFRDMLEKCFSLAQRHSLPFSVVMLDVDQFKDYNDSFGHPAGDEVLRTLARLLSGAVRVHDTVARYGGEEFALLLTGGDADAALGASRRLRRLIEQHPWPLRPVTASFGVSTYSPAMSCAAELVDQADRALYRAKEMGRNCVVHCHELSPNLPAWHASEGR